MTMTTLAQAVHIVLHLPRSDLSVAVGEYRYAERTHTPIDQARAAVLAALPIRAERDYPLAALLTAVDGLEIDEPAPIEGITAAPRITAAPQIAPVRRIGGAL